MIQNVFRRIVLRAPADETFVADVEVNIDHRRDDGLPGEVYMLRFGQVRRLPDTAVADNQSCIVDRAGAGARYVTVSIAPLRRT